MYAQAQDNPTARRSAALTGTLVLHAALLLFFILWKIITPIPPFPESEGGGSGLELSLGFTELGMGDNTQADKPDAPASQVEQTPSPQEETETLVSEVDDNEAVAPEKPKVQPKPVKPKPTPVTKPQPTKEQQEEAFRNKLNTAWNNKGSGSEGKGAADVPGVAGGNTGTAEGGGIGNGVGSYRGDGWSVDLAGRTIRRKPVINDKPSVGGKVVMDIWVDADGKVLRTTQNTTKSTTLDQSLVAIARRAVLESTFYPDPKATGEKKGTMTFIFTLQ